MKICIGLSGGVDSSVAALMLKEQGHDVFALFMQNWHDSSTTLHGDCEWEEDRFVAEMVARKIGIPFYFIDLSEEYRSRVVEYMFAEYAAGRTPNPDVLCNREIKFDAFLKAAESLGAEAVATGHYCRKSSYIGPDGKPIYQLLAGSDPGKDQSYFLCQLSQEQLSKAIFPIGHLLKSEVRRIAREADLQSADKKDSQGLCFVGKVALPVFLQQALQRREGEVVEVFDKFFESDPHYQKSIAIIHSLLKTGTLRSDVTDYISEDKAIRAQQEDASPFAEEKLRALTAEDLDTISTPCDYSSIVFETKVKRCGKHHTKKTVILPNERGAVIGTHDGTQFYTIGQRKGLNIGGHSDSIFIISLDSAANRIYVGQGHGHKGLSRSALKLDSLHYIHEDIALRPGDILRCRVRIRYRQPLQNAWLLCREEASYIIFDQAQRGITAGQFAAVYSLTTQELLCSGTISF